MEPEKYPPTHYIRRVPEKMVHAFTAVQLVALGVLWLVKSSVVGILFPLFICLLVPLRKILPRFFKEQHLAFLDSDEQPEEEADREID